MKTIPTSLECPAGTKISIQLVRYGREAPSEQVVMAIVMIMAMVMIMVMKFMTMNTTTLKW